MTGSSHHRSRSYSPAYPISFAEAYSAALSGGVPLIVTEQLFTSALPSNYTYTRADTVATYRNSSGELTLGASNTPRFNHTSAGVALGLLFEGSRINRCTNHNATPAATTNVSVTGTCTVTLVTDATALGTAKIANVVTGNVFQLAGGASGGTAIIAGGTSTTGACSATLWARDVTSTGASFGITPAPTTRAISGTAYARYVANNMTATATTDTMVITVPAGVTINFILNQLENAAFASTEIKTAGATATRQNCRISDTSVKTRGYWSGTTTQGGIIVEADTYDIGNHGAMFAYLSDNNDGTSGNINSLGTRLLNNRAKSDSQYNYYGPTPTNPFGSTDLLSYDKAGQGDLARITGGFSWQQGGTVYHYVNGNFRRSTSMGSFTTEPDRLYIGASVFTQHFFGHIRKITIFNKLIAPSQAGPYMVKTGDKCIISSGQSNMDGWWSNSTGSTNGGEQVAVQQLDLYWPSSRNFAVNGSTSGTAVSDHGGGLGTAWLSTDLTTVGVPFQRWLDIESGLSSAEVLGLFDTSGESDAGNKTGAEYKAAQIEKFTRMQNALGKTIEANYVPVILINLGRELGGSNLAGYQTIAEAGIELARDYSWIHYVERIDIAIDGTIHINDAGCQRLAKRTVRKLASVLGQTVTGPVDGPQITAVSRSGATVTVTIAHDTGATDFTPSSSIAGFHFFNNNVDTSGELTVTNAVRTDATTITLTLSSATNTTNQILYYGWRSLNPDTVANLVLDNSTETMPLRRAKWVSTDSGATFTSAF